MRTLRFCATLAALACALPVHAGLFNDDEARSQIASLRSQIEDMARRLDTLQQKLDPATQRLEAITQNQVEFSNQSEATKADIAKLRGQLDELTYNLDAAQKRQKDFYVDLDNRLRKIETQGQTEQGQAESKVEAAKAAENAALNDYEAALTALKAADYKAAVVNFESFIKNAPESPQQAGAHFFAGYCYSHLKQPLKAAEMYRQVVEKWPNDEHAPDALLAHAEILEGAGQRKDALTVLNMLVARYPATEAAKQAKAKLKKK